MATIMVIDDDPYIRELVSALLKNEGFIVHEVCNGREALQKLDDYMLSRKLLKVVKKIDYNNVIDKELIFGNGEWSEHIT